MPKAAVPVRSAHLDASEVAWFAPLCNGDDQLLGHHDPKYKSSWKNTSEIVRTADRLGYRNILCPSSYQVGQDTLPFVAAVGPQTEQINLLAAVRCGEIHPPMLGRTLATIDHILKGRLTINIISSDLPGAVLPSDARYQRSREVIDLLKQGWTQEEINFKGEFYDINLSTTEPVKPYQQNGGPLLYFGGYSPHAIDLCAEHCDVYLMWPEPEEKILAHMQTMSQKAAAYGRNVDFGLRVHVIVRETEDEAREAARRLMSHIDEEQGKEIRERALDAKSFGVSLQQANRESADSEGFVEPYLWTEIGKARSGCGAAIVGNPDQVLQKLRRYEAMGIRAFILSGYPHLDESELFARYVLSQMKTCSFPEVQARRPTAEPATPLAAGPRN